MSSTSRTTTHPKISPDRVSVPRDALTHATSTAARTDHRLAGKRILILNWREPQQATAGGAEVYAWEAAIAMRDAGAEVEFITSRDPGQRKLETVDGIQVRRGGGFYGVYAAAALSVLRQRRRVDAVLDAENGIPFFSPLWVPRTCPTVLLVHHVHLDQFAVHMSRGRTRLGQFVEGRLMPLVYRNSSVIAVSESTRSQMVARLGWTGPIQIIANGSPATAPHAKPAKTDELRIVALGRLVVHKRVDRIIDAVAQLRQSGHNIRLDIIGRGAMEAGLAEQIDRLGLNDSVELHGFLAEDRKISLLQRADLHICASDGEGWGQVVLEAAAVGVPTLARDVFGLRDAIIDGETGWLVRPGESLADGIIAVAEELAVPTHAAQIRQNCQRRADEFNWPRMREQIVGYLAEQLGTSQHR